MPSNHPAKTPRDGFSISEKVIALVFSFVVAVSTCVQCAIFYIDRTLPVQTAVYTQNVTVILNVIEKAHGASNEMAAAIRLLERTKNADPATIEQTWNAFANCGSSIELLSNDEVASAFLELQKELLVIRQEFLKWKHDKIFETYEEADLHAASLQEQCVSSIRKFIIKSKAAQGYGKLSKQLADRFGENLEKLYKGGGNGGGG